jgi:hypothetical protein
MPLPIAGALIGGVTQIASSIIGSGARKREQAKARQEYEEQRAAFKDFTFTNPYSSMENVFEDATINQQATQFQAQQTDQALAQSLQAATMAGGASGGAQAIAQAALQSKQGIAADIAQQEAANRAATLSQEAALQSAEAQAGDAIQQRQYGQTQQLLNMASGRKNAADAARAQATQRLVSGIGSIAGGLSSGGFFNSMGGAAGNANAGMNFGEYQAMGGQGTRSDMQSFGGGTRVGNFLRSNFNL